jgi:hypothetical protein
MCLPFCGAAAPVPTYVNDDIGNAREIYEHFIAPILSLFSDSTTCVQFPASLFVARGLCARRLSLGAWCHDIAYSHVRRVRHEGSAHTTIY